jgi:hypothetical protein
MSALGGSGRAALKEEVRFDPLPTSEPAEPSFDLDQDGLLGFDWK